MTLNTQEKIRFELAVCKMKGLWPDHDNSEYFAVGEDGKYSNQEIETLAVGWQMSSGNLDLSSVVFGRYHFLKDLLLVMIENKEISIDLALKINKFFVYRERYIDDMDYISDAYSALFDLEELFAEAIQERRQAKAG